MIHTILQGRIAVPNNTVIDSNFASYSNSAADVFQLRVHKSLTLTAPNGFVFINTKFASYGTLMVLFLTLQ
jgi:hypothetical protein